MMVVSSSAPERRRGGHSLRVQCRSSWKVSDSTPLNYGTQTEPDKVSRSRAPLNELMTIVLGTLSGGSSPGFLMFLTLAPGRLVSSSRSPLGVLFKGLGRFQSSRVLFYT